MTMRRLGVELGYEAMSLYKHIDGKDEILDAMIELVVSEIERPGDRKDWKAAMRQRAASARQVFARHSWAIALLEGRSSDGPETLRYRNAILGNLMSAGFSVEDAAHAFWLLDSYVYGQVIQETSMRPTTADESKPAPSSKKPTTVIDYPHLAAVYEHAETFGYSFDGEFDFGLDLILDALERHRAE